MAPTLQDLNTFVSYPTSDTASSPTYSDGSSHDAGMEEEWKVVIRNLSREVTDIYLRRLLGSAGTARKVSFYYPPLPAQVGQAEVTFRSKEEARNVLSLSGVDVFGLRLVILSTSPNEHVRRHSHASSGGYLSSEPEKRNLYVLNLPLDISNEELISLFQPYGNVMHACILAILDSCARRRGFILMGSGEEATAAMRALHGRKCRDYVLDVSYSVVQKRSTNLDYRPPEDIASRHSRSLSRARPPPFHYESLRALGNSTNGGLKVIDFGIPSHERRGSQQQQQEADPGKVLIVDNLCPTVFTSADDLVPVLSPFGEILSLDLFPSANSPEANAGLVHFRNSEHADQAADALDRQLFSNREIRITPLQQQQETPPALTSSVYSPPDSPQFFLNAPVSDDHPLGSLAPTPTRNSFAPIASPSSNNVPLAPAYPPGFSPLLHHHTHLQPQPLKRQLSESAASAANFSSFLPAAHRYSSPPYAHHALTPQSHHLSLFDIFPPCANGQQTQSSLGRSSSTSSVGPHHHGVKGWESHVGNGNGAATYGNVEGGWSPHSPGGRRRASESTLVGGYGEMSALQAQLSGLDIDQDLGAEPILYPILGKSLSQAL